MTHKSVDALLASTMFTLFVFAMPYYTDIASKFSFVDNALAQTYSASFSGASSGMTFDTVNTTSIGITNPVTMPSTLLKTTSTGAAAKKAVTYPTVKLSSTTKPATSVKQGASNVELASFDFTFNDPAKINFITLDLIGTSTVNKASGEILSLYVDGNKVSSANIDKKVTFSGLSIAVLGGSTKTLTVKVSNISPSINGSNEFGKTRGVKLTSYGATDFQTDFIFNESLQISGNLMKIVKEAVILNLGTTSIDTLYIPTTSIVKPADTVQAVNLKQKPPTSIPSTVTPFYYDPQGTEINAWVTVGGGATSPSTGAVSYTSIALDRDGYPYVAFKDGSNGDRATVTMFDGATWKNIGTAGFSKGKADFTNMIIDSYNLPYVAFKDGANGDKATVMRYNGNDWVYAGNEGFSNGAVNNIHLQIGTDGSLYVAFSDESRYGKATVMKYDMQKNKWDPVGKEAFSNWRADRLSFALGLNNTPYVAFVDTDNDSKITVMKYDGTNWVNVGKLGFHSSNTLFTSIAIDLKGDPYVLFSYLENINSSEYRRYHGVFKYNSVENYWIENRISDDLIISSKPDYVFSNANVALSPTNNLFVSHAYRYKKTPNAQISTSGRLVGLMYTGSKWVDLGQEKVIHPAYPPEKWISSDAAYESIVVNKNGIPYIAFAEYGNDKKLRVERLSNDPDAKSITSFKIQADSKEYLATIDEKNKTIKLTLPQGTNIKSITPIITFSKAAVISPASGVAKDFSKTQIYKVTAPNGTTKNYSVRLEISQKVDPTINKYQ